MRSLPDPGFAGDNGAADPTLTAALAAADADPTGRAVLAVLCRARLLVPVVALAGELATDGPTGLPQEKSADVAAVLLRRPDGRRALLAFTSLETLRTWDPAARPVPVTARDAARSAIHEGADALLVDLAGPVRLVVETDELAHLAAGHLLAATSSGYVWLAEG